MKKPLLLSLIAILVELPIAMYAHQLAQATKGEPTKAQEIANQKAPVASATCNLHGPIENPGMQVVVDAKGVQTPGYRFANSCRKPTAWQAHPIWVSRDAPIVGWFRKEITLSAAPRRAVAWVTADMKYRLWINGRLVSRGPADIGRDGSPSSTHRWFYDHRDLTPFFRTGRNVIAAEVFRTWPASTVSRGQPGFLFEAGVDELTVKSDATWRAIPAPPVYGWRSERPVAYGDFDLTALTIPTTPVYGWLMPEFDDASWSLAREVKAPWASDELVASELPPLMETRYPAMRIDGLPGSRVCTKDTSFRVLFDRVLSGFPIVTLKGGKGAKVTIKAMRQVSFALGSGEQTLAFPFMDEIGPVSTSGWRYDYAKRKIPFPVTDDEITPSFTVELKHVTEPVEILDCYAVFTSQPVEYRGAFECSDESLNRIWKASRWGVQICLQTHHLDSTNHQEPLMDPGDYVIEAMVNNYAFAQPWLTRQDVRKFAWLLKDTKYHNFHTSYSISWLEMLMDYHDYTGDKTLVEEMSPYVHELLATYTSWRGKNGIISEAPNYMFMDWVEIAGFGCHHPPAVIGQGYLTALYYHGLEMASRIAAAMNDRALVQRYAQLRREVAVAFDHELWNDAEGLYRDGKPGQTSVKPYKWLPADQDIETFSPHVNLLAVLYDLAPKERQRAIVEKVMAEKPLNAQPWFMHWVFQALDHAGLFEKYGTSQMRRWQIVPETQSFREMWTYGKYSGGDFSHGWCSTPLVQMSARVLGVRPTSPGYKKMTIRPTVCDLKWARGIVPTPHGNVRVSWEFVNDKLSLDVTVPVGTEADVILPAKTAHVRAGQHTFHSDYKRVW